MHATKTFSLASIGCRTNQYEIEAVRTQLTKLGLTEAKSGADLCVINTCTVTESADSNSRAAVRKLAKENPSAKLVVTGCHAERISEEVKELSLIVVPNGQKEALLETVFPDVELPEFAIEQFASRTRAFVKIQDGCNAFCTYCLIPYVRGRSRSYALEKVLRETQGLVERGFKEVVFTGVNIGDFDGAPADGEKGSSLAELLREVDGIEGLERVRLSSIDPEDVNDDLIDAIMSGTRTCPSLHLVLQSGSNAMLKRMNRKYTRQQFLHVVDTLRKRDPSFTFTTDVIVGFPGETESDFNDTLEVIRSVKFAKVHMFPYSARPRTRAATYSDQISEAIKKERKDEVLRVAQDVAYELRDAYVGQVVDVLIECFDDSIPPMLTGHTKTFLPVMIKPDPDLGPNQLVTVLLKENRPDGLLGKRLK